jgi:hypothetical protein
MVAPAFFREPTAVYVRGRSSTRHMKGKQVALTLYLSPRKYWLLKAVSTKAGVTMQHLLRTALDDVLRQEHRQLYGSSQGASSQRSSAS